MTHFGRKICFLLGVLFSLSGMVAHAQNVRIKGTVKDSVTGENLELVTVRLLETKYGANSNLDGEFEIYAPPGEYILYIQLSGYDHYLDTLGRIDENVEDIEVLLTPVSTGVEGVTITSKAVNPAHRVIRNAIKRRKYNRFDKIDAYEYEAYNKLVLSMDNVTDKLLKTKIIDDIGEKIKEMMDDTTHSDTSKYKLAVFISESVSRFYYKRPDMKKEEILAVRTSGIEGSEMNLLSSMFLQIDVYDNNIGILNKQFLSPIAAGAFLDYEYELISTQIFGRDTLYGIKIIPKRPYDPVFKGEIYIDNHDWAINRIDLQMNKDPNINFVEDVRIRQEYQKVDTHWVPTLLDLEVDFQNSAFKRKGGNGAGVIGRTSSYLYDYKINEPKEPKFYKQEVMEVKMGAEDKDSTFWEQHRRSPLEKSEKLGYAIVDSVKDIGLMRFYIEAFRTLAVGTKRTKYLELGPYWYLVGFNQIEGPRFRFGLYTNRNFSKRLYLGGHLAYGLKDKQFKYLGEMKYVLNVKPRLELGLKKVREVEQVGVEDFLEEGTSLMMTMLRRVPLRQLNYYNENKVSLYYDLTRGIATTLHARTKSFEPGSTFDFLYLPDSNRQPVEQFSFSEIGANFRISFREDYIIRQGKKLYISSNWPIFNLKLAYGMKGPLGGDLDYKKVELSASNWMRVGKFGYTDYKLTAGVIFGDLPYPALQVFRGTMSYGYDPRGFNLMDFYEFVADRYVMGVADHHFEGLLWNRLPLLRKLKFKTVATARVAWGTLRQQNVEINNIDVPTADGGVFEQRIKAPDQLPYVEAGVGLENILKFFRIDGVWRLNYHNLRFMEDPVRFPKSNWGRFNNFGLRINMVVSF